MLLKILNIKTRGIQLKYNEREMSGLKWAYQKTQPESQLSKQPHQEMREGKKPQEMKSK